MMAVSAERSAARVVAITGVCAVTLLVLTIIAGSSGSLDAIVVRTPSVHEIRAAELGIGELEMGPDFGRPAAMPERGPVATVLLYGVLLLCPAKFVFLWALQRRESRHVAAPAFAPRTGGA